MARYTGPKSKIARKLGEPIFGEDKVFAKKNYPPGQHGANRRRKQSEYGLQLREKQKAKYTYGVLERQFRNLFEKASSMKGVTGEVLLQLLEQRLDIDGIRFRDLLCNGGNKVLEIVGLGDEVGLAVDFHDDADFPVVGNVAAYDAFRRDASRFLGGRGESLLAQIIDRLFSVAVAFGQSLLAIHHTGTGALAQCHNIFRCKHSIFLRINYSAAASSAGASSSFICSP